MTRFEPTPMKAFLRPRKEFFVIADTERYKRVTVKLHAQGVVLRDQVYGSQLRTKKQQAIRAGDLLVAEIDAKVGGVGIVPSELAGAIVSSHYFLYEIDDTICRPKYLDYYIRSGAVERQFQEFVQGSTNYASVRAHHTLELQIPLPPLDEQRRVVARIEELAVLIEEARELRVKAREEAEFLLVGALRSLREELLGSSHPKEQIGRITRVTSGGTPSRATSSYWNGDIPWVKTGELNDSDIRQAEEHITQEGLDHSSAKLFPPNTVLIALYGQGQTRGRTGRLMIEAATNQACCAILPVPSLLEPRYLQYWLQSLYYEMREMAYGGAQPNWSGQMVKQIEISLIPLSEQRRIASYFSGLQAQVRELTILQNSTQTELDALLPSVLDMAFRGGTVEGMIMADHKVYAAIVSVVRSGQLVEPFGWRDFRRACPGFAEGTYRRFLNKHCLDNPDGTSELFERVRPGRFRLLHPIRYGL